MSRAAEAEPTNGHHHMIRHVGDDWDEIDTNNLNLVVVNGKDECRVNSMIDLLEACRQLF